MNNASINPYEPPGLPAVEPMTWWEWFRNLLLPAKTITPIESFLLGKRWIFCGVVFGISPKDSTTLTARLPLAKNEERLIQANVTEAQRVLGEFLAHWPELGETLRGRTLEVLMVTSYDQRAGDVARVEVPAEVWQNVAFSTKTDSENA